MATSIPPHNLGEVCDAAVAYIDDPAIDLDELMEHHPRPRLPHRRHHLRPDGASARRTGPAAAGSSSGPSTTIEEQKDGRSQIIFTEIPYQLTKEPLLKKLAELVNGGRITGVTDIVDESATASSRSGSS